MNMQNTLRNIQNSIFPIIFNAIFFVLIFNTAFFGFGGANHKASVWISYGFIHFAYFMLLLAPKMVRAGKSEAILGFSLYFISATYFCAEFFIGGLFMLVALSGYKAALLIQFCMAGVYGFVLISHIRANEATADAEEKQQYQIEYVKTASTKLNNLLDKIDDKGARKKVERVYDALYSSPVKSHPDLAQMENRILQTIHSLEHAVATKNLDGVIALAGTLETAINERNSQLKMYH